jgi:hypothetical protein
MKMTKIGVAEMSYQNKAKWRNMALIQQRGGINGVAIINVK